MGKREQLPVNTKGSQVSPRLAEVVVKQLDPRWARQGATAALLKAAGYSTDVAVKTEYAGIFQHTCLAGPAILADLMWQRPRWQRQLQILLCASCPGPFSFKASRSASQSRAACKTSTSSAMQGQSIPQASRKPRSRSDGPTGNRPSRSSGIHQLRSRSRGLLHLRLVWGCQGLCLMRSLCWRPSLMTVGACLFFRGLQLR